MIISHTHKFIFIKSFKTAGTSIESTLSNYCSGNDIVTPINDYRHNRNEKGEFTHKAMNAEEFIELGLDNLQHVKPPLSKTRYHRTCGTVISSSVFHETRGTGLYPIFTGRNVRILLYSQRNVFITFSGSHSVKSLK